MKWLRTAGLLSLGLFVGVGVAGAQSLQRVDAGGGAVAPPVTQGDYLYVGTGSTVSVWNMADPTQPVYAGRTNQAPAAGTINGLAIVGGYLYAGWTNPLGTGGLTVYSLADPLHPAAVAENDEVFASSIAASGNYVYVGDAYNAQLVVVDVSDPLHPTVGAAVSGFDAASDAHMSAFGSRLIASGTNFTGDRPLDVFDLSDPAHPVKAGFANLDGLTVLRAALSENYAFGIGFELQVYDLTDPTNISQIFDASIDEATGALLRGDMLYLIGATGIQVWDFSVPSTPVLLRTVPADVFAPDQVADTAFGPLLLTHTDHGLLLDTTDAGNPAVASDFAIPVGVSVHNAAFDAGHVYFAEEGYGIGVADAQTLAPIGRFDAYLPEDLQQRDVEGIAVDGDRAYLAFWGYGVIIADLSDPTHPTQLGSFEFPFATAIQAQGNFVYVGSSTNGGIFKVLDVTNPASPQELGSIGAGQIYALALNGDYAFLADDMGMHIVDISNPAAPTIASSYSDCASSGGLAVSDDGNTTYLACTADGSLRILDTTEKNAPVQLGSVTLPDNPLLPGYGVAYDVVIDGTMAYVGNVWGVDEIDISNPAAPAAGTRHETAFDVRKVAKAPDGRIFAFAGLAGIYVYAPATADRIFADGFD